jgi:hypothetical protein
MRQGFAAACESGPTLHSSRGDHGSSNRTEPQFTFAHRAERAEAVESAAEHTDMLHHAPDTEARDRSG